MKNLEHDLAALQEDLSAERDHSSTLAQSSESTLQGVRQEMGGLKATLDRSQAQNDLLEKTVEEQRTELVELRLKVSDLELHKESLLFQSSTNESTIASLRGQVGLRSHKNNQGRPTEPPLRFVDSGHESMN